VREWKDRTRRKGLKLGKIKVQIQDQVFEVEIEELRKFKAELDVLFPTQATYTPPLIPYTPPGVAQWVSTSIHDLKRWAGKQDNV
jgi:hypothetical protein